MRSYSLLTAAISCLFVSVGCSADGGETPGGTGGSGASTVVGSGGAGQRTGGTTGSGSAFNSSGSTSGGGAVPTAGGQPSSGGGAPGGGGSSTGGIGSGSTGSGSTGSGSTGGDSSGGGSFGGDGGSSGGDGGSTGGDGGSPGGDGGSSGGDGGSGGTSTELDCDAKIPTSGGTTYSDTWKAGGDGNLAWQIWSNGGPGNITVYDGVPAFTAFWNNSGDFLGRMGMEWGNSGKKYTEYGTIKADYVWEKFGDAGQYSYLGIYGWSTNPCVEWYIVEDSFHNMPFNTGDQPVGTVDIDGGTYNLVYRRTSGTGGDRCGGAGNWEQFYSIRLEGKQCGTIDITKHFDAWAAQGWTLGNLLEAKVVVEAAAGNGSVDFAVANVTTTQ